MGHFSECVCLMFFCLFLDNGQQMFFGCFLLFLLYLAFSVVRMQLDIISTARPPTHPPARPPAPFARPPARARAPAYMYTLIYIYRYINVCICVYIYVLYIYMYLCVYIRLCCYIITIYMHIHKYTDIYIHIYTVRFVLCVHICVLSFGTRFGTLFWDRTAGVTHRFANDENTMFNKNGEQDSVSKRECGQPCQMVLYPKSPTEALAAP
jgi:hypothetical protein